MYPSSPLDTRKVSMITDKKYVWCFMGQTLGRKTRQSMIKELDKIKGENFKNINSSWQSEDMIKTEDYKKIIKSSIFTPCPKGNRSKESFRLYEALEAGSIPIIEESDCWNKILGEHPLLQTDPEWKKAKTYIESFLGNKEFLELYQKKIKNWWELHKMELKEKITTKIDLNQKEIHKENLPTEKQKHFLEIKENWKNFTSDSFIDYASRKMKSPTPPSSMFSKYNPNKKIAIVSLYTKEIEDYAVFSEKDIKKYCERHGYTFYVYRTKLDQNGSPNWSKAKALLNHISDHDHIIWMDSDTIIFNPSFKIENITESCSSCKQIIACEDIGNNSMLNSGVVIFKNNKYCINILKKWKNFEGNKDSLYASGGDQEILCDILKKSDGFGFNRKIMKVCRREHVHTSLYVLPPSFKKNIHGILD